MYGGGGTDSRGSAIPNGGLKMQAIEQSLEGLRPPPTPPLAAPPPLPCQPSFYGPPPSAAVPHHHYYLQQQQQQYQQPTYPPPQASYPGDPVTAGLTGFAGGSGFGQTQPICDLAAQAGMSANPAATTQVFQDAAYKPFSRQPPPQPPFPPFGMGAASAAVASDPLQQQVQSMQPLGPMVSAQTLVALLNQQRRPSQERAHGGVATAVNDDDGDDDDGCSWEAEAPAPHRTAAPHRPAVPKNVLTERETTTNSRSTTDIQVDSGSPSATDTLTVATLTATSDATLSAARDMRQSCLSVLRSPALLAAVTAVLVMLTLAVVAPPFVLKKRFAGATDGGVPPDPSYRWSRPHQRVDPVRIIVWGAVAGVITFVVPVLADRLCNSGARRSKSQPTPPNPMATSRTSSSAMATNANKNNGKWTPWGAAKRC